MKINELLNNTNEAWKHNIEREKHDPDHCLQYNTIYKTLIKYTK